MITDNMMHIDPAASAAALDTIPEDASTRDCRSDVDNQDSEEIKTDSWGENYWNRHSTTQRHQRRDDVANDGSQAFTAPSIASTTEAVIDERKQDILGLGLAMDDSETKGMPDNSLRSSTSALLEESMGRGRRRGSWGREPNPPIAPIGLEDVGEVEDPDDIHSGRVRQPIKFSSINWKMWVVLIFLLLLVVAGIIVVVEVLSTTSSSPPSASPPSPTPDGFELTDDFYPTPYPSEPSIVPSSPPSIPRKTRIDDYLMERTAVLNPPNEFLQVGTPQNDAYQWMLSTDTYAYDDYSTANTRMDQRYALAVFYFATEGENWLVSNEFLLSDKNECEWNGVQCKCNSPAANSTDINNLCIVHGIKLIDVNLKGPLPLDFFHFLSSSLMALDFQNNSLTGPNPFIAHAGSPLLLEQMRYLELSHNQLTGSIPSSVCQTMPNLTSLYLVDNLLDSSFPEEFLTLDPNSTIPIKRLWLTNNSLTGSLPASIKNWRDLVVLKLDHNQFNSTLPNGLWKLPNLKYLHLSDNKFVGSLQGVEKSLSLISIHLDNNLFTGTLPTSLPLTTEVAWFNYNNLTGQIPPCFGVDSANLTSLRLHDNPGLSGDLYCPSDDEYSTVCGGVFSYQVVVAASDPNTTTTSLVSASTTETNGNSRLYTCDCNKVDCSCCECYYY
mmetsp:Transcript_17212/g.26080  ORF Transcript_17212/g.26080 Transcript_17212/m.26080 type:complete len:667 (+) Transcript_17212:162-2162(+)